MSTPPSPPIQTSRDRPVVADSGRTVGEFVRDLHEYGIERHLAPPSGEPSGRNLTTDQIEAVLTYCAEQQCTAADLTCPGCRLDTQKAGIASIDDFVRRFEQLVLTDSDLEIAAGGSEHGEAPSLGWLTRNWAGEEYWFWARRVLRKLRYGLRQVDELIADGAAPAPAVILVEPQIPENIGMVARAMGNFAIDEMRVVQPRDGWPSEKARAVASGAAAILDDAGRFNDLPDAISDLNWVAATTARQRDMRKPVMTPEEAAREMTARIARGEKCGILFGRERNGLQTDEVALADAMVMIPINNRFASLNLAQAVLILGYEWLKATGEASLGRVTPNEQPLVPGINLGANRPATREELIGLFEHLELELDRAGFFNPPHRRRVVVRNVRTMLMRMQATEQEVRTLRGIVATLSHRKSSGRNASD